MWECPKCHEIVGDELEVCWNCGTTEDGVEDPHFRHAEDIRPEDLTSPGIPIPLPAFDELPPAPSPKTKPPPVLNASTAIQELDESIPRSRPPNKQSLPCPRCNREMAFAGRKSFPVGFVGGSMDLDVYICGRCGRIEFFVSDIAEQFQPAGEISSVLG